MLLTLDNGRQWDPEPFQLDIVDEVMRGYREVLAVLPTGNAKTTLCGGIALYVCQFKPGAMVPIGAAAKDQAGVMYDQAEGFVVRSRGLSARFKPQPGYKRIVGPAGSLIKVYSASEDTGDGIIPDLAFIDEYHRHKSDGLRATWRDKLTKRGGQMLTISTAGDDDENPLEQLRAEARKLPNVQKGRTRRHLITRTDDLSFVMHEHALLPGDDSADLALVKQANPLEQVTIEELRMRRDSPSTRPWQWERFTCNRPVKGEDTAIQPGDWDALKDESVDIPDGEDVTVGLDLAFRTRDGGDTTALVPVWLNAEGRFVVADPQVFVPPEGGTLDAQDVVDALLEMAERWRIRVVYDPNAGGHQMAQQMEREHGLDFIEHSQKNTPMALASVRLAEAIRTGSLVHDGDPRLRAHALNAIDRPLGGEMWRYDRPKRGARRPIDALTALLMAHSVMVAELEAPQESPAFEVLL